MINKRIWNMVIGAITLWVLWSAFHFIFPSDFVNGLLWVLLFGFIAVFLHAVGAKVTQGITKGFRWLAVRGARRGLRIIGFEKYMRRAKPVKNQGT